MRKWVGANELGILLVLIGLVVIIGIFNPAFISRESFANIGLRASWYGILALGTVFLLSMGEIDLSIGSMYALVINATAIMMAELGLDPWLAAAVGLLLGFGLGAVNGVLANTLGLAAIIITLGTLSAYRGLSFIASGGRFVYGLPREHSFFRILGSEPLGVPLSVWVLIALTVCLAVVYRSTRYGFAVRAIGSNRQAARLSGIPVNRIRLITLSLMGGLCAVAGLLTLAFFSTADPNLGTGYELQAIAAAIIGGTALSGGRGTVVGALLGAAVIAVIGSGIIQFGVPAHYSIFVTGVLIVVAVGFDALIRRRQERRRLRTEG